MLHCQTTLSSPSGIIFCAHILTPSKARRGEGNGTHSSTLAWKIHGWRSLVAAVHGIAKSRTQLSDLTFTFYFHALEKEMATHSSVLAWRIPGTEEPNGLLSMGLHRVGHDRSDLAAAAAKQDKFALQVQNDKKALN